MSETRSAGVTQAQARIDFQIVPVDQLPPGKTCTVVEVEGRIVASIGQGHASSALCDDLAHLHRTLTEQGRWVQTPFDGEANRIEQPAEGRRIARVAWERVAGDVLPAATLAAPVEQDGLLVWLLHEDHVSASLCSEMSGVAERIAGDGLWRQNWPS